MAQHIQTQRRKEIVKSMTNIRRTKFWIGWISLAMILMAATGASALCPESIQSYWKLEDGFYSDETGNLPNGSCTSCPTQNLDAVVGEGQTFNSGDDVTFQANSRFDWDATASFTIEFWIKRAPGISADEAAVGRVDGASSLFWWVGVDTNGRAHASLVAQDGSGTSSDLTGSADLADNNWHHVALIRDGAAATTYLYVDGIQTDSANETYSAGFGSASGGITLGWIDTGDNKPLNASLDEVAIYNSALNDSEILQHFNDGIVGLRIGYCSDSSPIRIMPLGDSITRGSLGDSTPNSQIVGYRQKLDLDLFDIGLDGDTDYDIDLVGSLQSGHDLIINPPFDADHEGHGGAYANEIAIYVAGYLAANPADIILLHIGTNDILLGDNPIWVRDEVEDILNAVDGVDTAIPVVLAKIVEADPGFSNTETLNNLLSQLVANRPADKLIVTDHYSALNYPADMSPDDIHPNPSGYQKMAGVWYNALVALIPPTYKASPQITSQAVDKVNVGIIYSYNVEAQGNEAPQYSILSPASPPGNMAINTITGLLTWTPQAGDTDVNMDIEAANDSGSDTQAFTITVGSNPVATDDEFGPVTEGGSLNIPTINGVLKNDTDADLDALQSVLSTDVQHGNLTLNSDGSFVYLHDGDEDTEDSFTYQATDSVGFSNTATVSIEISPVNDPPVAVDDDYVLLEGGTLNIDASTGVLANDQDDEDDSLIAVLLDDVIHGTLVLNNDGSFSYTHDGSESSDSFTYRVFDGTDTSATPATVNLNITPVNTPPQITGQQLINSWEDTSLTIMLTHLVVLDPDNTFPDDFTLTVQDGTNYSRTGNTILPDNDYNGSLTIPVRVSDGQDDSTLFDLAVTIDAANDAPVITAQASPLSTEEEIRLVIPLSALSVDDVDNTYPNDFTILVQNGDNYTADGSGLIPDSGFVGTLIVSVTVDDNTGTPTAESDPFDLTVTVFRSNEAPVISGQNPVNTLEDTELAISLADLVVSDPDNTYPDDFTLSVQAGTGYTRNGNTILPNTNFSGTIQVPVTVNDGDLDSNTFNLTVTVTPVNDPPVILSQGSLVLPDPVPFELSFFNLTVEDVDNIYPDDFSMTVFGNTNFTVDGQTITPDNGFEGILDVPVQVNDGQADSNIFNVRVIVNITNETPQIVGQETLQVLEGQELVITLQDLTVDDEDNIYPDDFTLQVYDGTSYTRNVTTIKPADGVTGTIFIPVTVNDGLVNSNQFNLEVQVTTDDDDDDGGGGGGGGGCFIMTAGKSDSTVVAGCRGDISIVRLISIAILSFLFTGGLKDRSKKTDPKINLMNN
jgi:VCBS repeat-containing protein